MEKKKNEILTLRFVFAICIAALMLHFWRYGNVPTKKSMSDVVADVNQERAEGDALMVRPPWLLQHLEGQRPLEVDRIIRTWNDFFKIGSSGRVFVVSAFRPGWHGVDVGRGYEKTLEKRFWKIELMVFTPRNKHPAFDFKKHLLEASLTLDFPDGTQMAAQKVENRLTLVPSGAPDWLDAYQVNDYFGSNQWDAIRFHPYSKAVKNLLFKDVPRGRFIWLGFGLTNAARDTATDFSPVHFKIFVNDKLVRKFAYRPRDGWVTEKIRVRSKKKDRVDVRFEVSTENESRKNFCLDAYMVNK